MTSIFNSRHASKELLDYVSGILNFTEMNDFEMKYNNLIQEYHTKPDLYLLSSIKVAELESFKAWAPIALSHSNNIFPLLICKMLEGDIFSLSIYDNLKKISDNQSLVVSYNKIYQNHHLQEEFNRHGGAEDARAILTAEYWLQSAEAASIIGETELGVNSLCLVNNMLHLTNNYIECV